MYTQGSFLESHTDSPSGSGSYERVRAFVLHLSQGFEEADGGLFLDEETGERFVPEWNTLVHFQVPRWHSVTKVTANKRRFAIYGWVLVPQIQCLEQPQQLQQLSSTHPVMLLAVLPRFGAAVSEAGTVLASLAHEPSPVDPGCFTRGDYIHTVSYTHLTLPTKRIVEISVVGVSLKKHKIKRTNLRVSPYK
eukprot:TRINITY_DN11885_c0_g1_i1.p1 TRINITY_DN11885_c0_g1~~TRINITY_DN11885_c0_g1_i1.p1  ORF type:complete len:192 (-),score=25.07 TRINITY_DN11885_c0_g1_i1:10-585(-)